MFQSRCICHVTHEVVGEQLKAVRGAVGELPGKAGEQVVQFLLSESIAPCAQDTYGFVTGPERPARGGITVVDSKFRIVQLGPHPGQEIGAIAHATSMVQAPRSLLGAGPASPATTALLDWAHRESSSQGGPVRQLDYTGRAGRRRGPKRFVFADVTSGSKTAVARPGMKKLLEYAEEGDIVAGGACRPVAPVTDRCAPHRDSAARPRRLRQLRR